MVNTEQVGRDIIERVKRAINAHDLDGLATCFAPNVESVQPAHPARAFRGRDQLRKNWSEIFGGIPDLSAELLHCVVEGEGAWSEWRWRGTRVDGASFEMRGVTIQRIQDGMIASLRFYMEPVDRSGADVEAAVRAVVAGR